jgi:hypothetical protein
VKRSKFTEAQIAFILCLHCFISRSAPPASSPSDDAESSGQARSKLGGMLKPAEALIAAG